MNIAEKLLLKFCIKKQDDMNSSLSSRGDFTEAMSQLTTSFSGFENDVKGKRVLDFGCGEGEQAIFMARSGAAFVVGVDINRGDIAKASIKARQLGISEEKIWFVATYQVEQYEKFDIILSHNSFEHFEDPVYILKFLRSALNPKGRLYITFGPPWLAPYGAHMQFFCRLPWAHLFFSERTIMNVRSRFRLDGAKHYEEVEGGLNKMTVGRFEKILKAEGFKIKYKKYECIKKLNIFRLIPGLRELFINQVSCMVEMV